MRRVLKTREAVTRKRRRNRKIREHKEKKAMSSRTEKSNAVG
jgi:hypothetical protein